MLAKEEKMREIEREVRCEMEDVYAGSGPS